MATLILDGAVSRVHMDGHEGKSDARLERVELADGRRLVVKTATPGTDLAMRLSRDIDGRERVLWATGVAPLHAAFAGGPPPDVAQAVADIHADPRRLAVPLAARSSTMVDGDLVLANVALEPAQLTLLDWGLATWAPPALDPGLVGGPGPAGAGRRPAGLTAGLRSLAGVWHCYAGRDAQAVRRRSVTT